MGTRRRTMELTGNTFQEKDVEINKEEKAAEKAPEAPAEPKKDIPKLAMVTVDLVNVRKTPGGEILKTAIKNAEFKVAAGKSADGFVAVIVDGQVAFIKEDFVKVFDNPAYAANAVDKKL